MKNKWNWIDTTIVIVIIVIIIIFMNRGRLSQTIEGEKSNLESITIIVEADEIREDMLTNLNVGDQFFSQNSLQPAFVEDISITPHMRTVVAADGTITEVESLEEVNIEVEISAEVAKDGPYMDLAEQEIKVGLAFIMKTTDVEFPGRIKHIEVN